MIRNILTTIFLVFFTLSQAQAHIDIVYPTEKELTINGNSTFFSGNTNSNAILEINSKKVNLWEDGFFVHVVPLEYGINKIQIKSSHDGIIEKDTFKIIRNKPTHHRIKKGKKPIKPEYIKNDDGVLYAKTIKDRATVRSAAKQNSTRITDLQKGIVLYLDGKLGDYYKIQENGKNEFWIHKSNITEPVKVSKRTELKLKDTKQYTDKFYDYQKFYLSHPVLFTSKQHENKIYLTIYGEENIEYKYEFDTPILGYEFYYDENTLIFKKAKFPFEIDEENPLKAINIFIDAGHGGSEKGTIGPSRVLEKDVNLDIAKNLINLLNAAGANVSYSRTDDKQVNLYDRVEQAKENNALISLSIHCNSLPYTKDPYSQHGTEVHYYNENAKLLAEIIKFNLANDLNIKDNGIHKSSFALNRSTNPVSVLVEVAYMINPDEYILLKNSAFRKNVAKSIKKSLEEYILLLKNKKK